MSSFTSHPFQSSSQPLRHEPSYTAVSTSDDNEYSPEGSSLSEQDWKKRRKDNLDSQKMLLDSPFGSKVSLNRFSSVLERWKRPINDVRSQLPTGWKFGAWIATFQAGSVLLINIVILIWSAVKTGGASSGVVFEGDCDEVDQYSIGIHLVINILSTLLLGASNYMMQSLCAPTRFEVDVAHERGLWLDIGLQSWRNLKYISRRRRILWIALSLSSIPLHLLYNSSFFSTLSSNEYTVYLALGPDLQTLSRNADGRYNWTCGYGGCPGDVNEIELSQWDILNPSECIQAYAIDFVSNRDTVVLVAGDYVPNGTLILAMGGSEGGGKNDSYEWICDEMDTFNDSCSSMWRHIDPSNWKYKFVTKSSHGTSWQETQAQIRYCLSQPAVPKCQLEFNLPLLIVVIAFNVVKLVCMAFAAIHIKDNTLVTIGDAIASFTSDPDSHTRDMCLASRNHFNPQNMGRKFTPLRLEYQPQKLRWLNAASKQYWIWTISLFAGAISIILGLLVYSVVTLKSIHRVTGFTALWQFGIGKPHSQNIITGWAIPTNGYSALLASVLISNSPQIILSIIYLAFNSLWTKLFLALEWSSYARSRKPLRVSSPQGKQRSTYFLQIPYRFGLPLMAYSALLHWLVSQSIFLVKVSYWDNTYPNQNTGITSCGYSPAGMILTIIVGTTLILGAVIIGFFTHLNGDMPLVGSCSAAISASCHPPTDGSDSLKPMKWGVVVDAKNDGKKNVAHVSFSSGVVLEPIPGCYYS